MVSRSKCIVVEVFVKIPNRHHEVLTPQILPIRCVECAAGTELIDNVCVPCEEGFYSVDGVCTGEFYISSFLSCVIFPSEGRGKDIDIFKILYNITSYRVRNFRGRVSYFNQSDARKHCFLASDWLKYETLPRKFRTLFLATLSQLTSSCLSQLVCATLPELQLVTQRLENARARSTTLEISVTRALTDDTILREDVYLVNVILSTPRVPLVI